jgi:hypothetical protein
MGTSTLWEVLLAVAWTWFCLLGSSLVFIWLCTAYFAVFCFLLPPARCHAVLYLLMHDQRLTFGRSAARPLGIADPAPADIRQCISGG